jgi:hypothetical protein
MDLHFGGSPLIKNASFSPFLFQLKREICRLTLPPWMLACLTKGDGPYHLRYRQNSTKDDDGEIYNVAVAHFFFTVCFRSDGAGRLARCAAPLRVVDRYKFADYKN